MFRTWQFFTLLTSKYASHHNNLHFFNSATSESAPGMVCLYHFDFQTCFLPQRCGHLNFQKCSKSHSFSQFWIRNALPATVACTFQQLNFQKCTENGVLLPFLNFKCASCHNDVQCPPFRHLNFQKRSKSDNSLTVLTSKCASCHNGVHVFNSATSESATRMVCLHHFDFQMCFPPQQRALFRHLNPKELRTWQFFNRFDFEICFAPQQRALFQQLNFQKWCKNGVFFNILTSNCASKCAFAEPGSFSQFWFRNVATRRFGEPTFRSFRAPKHWENKVFRDFSSFLRSCIFFLLTFSLFSASFFCLSLTALFPPLLFICLHCRKSEF